jgi:hypothetical protein
MRIPENWCVNDAFQFDFAVAFALSVLSFAVIDIGEHINLGEGNARHLNSKECHQSLKLGLDHTATSNDTFLLVMLFSLGLLG